MDKTMPFSHAVSMVRSSRKTLAIEIGKKGIVIRAPYKMPAATIEAFLRKKEDWIERTLQKYEKRRQNAAGLPPLTQAEIRALTARAKVVLPAKVKHYAALFGVDYAHITVRCQRTLWGSCSSNGNLSFNCLLMLLPDEIVDSVVAHELCHRKHMNHSPAFYAELSRVFPNYPNCRAWLKENGGIHLERIEKMGMPNKRGK